MNDHFSFEHKRVVILGLARQGIALARFFAHAGAQVTVSDTAGADRLQPELRALTDLPIDYVLGGHPPELLDDCDLLCLSGGVPPQLPIVAQALARGIRLSNDGLLTLQLARRRKLGPIVAITGSSGKTTTTTLVGQMLSDSGLRVHVGGNIGTPLIDRLDAIRPGDVLVLELSSFQLELFDPAVAWGPVEGIGPDVAAILNITPNHPDRHPNMAAYAAAKFNLLHCLPPGASVVLGADDAVTGALVRRQVASVQPAHIPVKWHMEETLAQAQSSLDRLDCELLPFSRLFPLEQGAWLEGDRLVVNDIPFCRRGEVLLRGDHNVSNILAAAAIADAAGGSPAAAGQVAATFTGVPHRLEIVSIGGGVTWINDSIATSPERAVAALRSFEPGVQTLILLAGGKDKNLPWEHFADEVLNRVSMLIGFGAAGHMIVRTVQDRARLDKRSAPSCAVVQRLDEAVDLAARAAQPNTVVLLSPGGTSYDAYRDFEARGVHFRQLVGQCAQAAAEPPARSSSLAHGSW